LTLFTDSEDLQGMSRWWTRALAALSVALTIASVEAAERFSGITVFGDSLSDSGQFAGVGGPAGTFTNPDTDGSPGAIYLARLSDRYGFALAPTTPLIGSAAPGANNYAVGGYVTDEVLASIVSESRVQIGSLLATRPGYLVENPVADRRRLYVAWAGGNDIRRALDPDTQADNILASIQALHDAGARYILVNRLPDIGAVPESTFLGPSSVQSRSAASEQFNARLDAGIAAGAANVVYTDVTGFLGETQAEPVSFGLAPVDHRQVCYEAPGFPFTQCNVDPTYGSGGAQDNPDLMLFYDGIHPTQEGHRRLGEYIVSVLEAPTLISSLAEVPLASARAHQRSLESQMEQPVASNGWRSFAAGSYGRLEADADGLAPGWDQSGYALDLGAVYGYGNGWQSGIGLGISGEEVDFAADRGGSTCAAITSPPSAAIGAIPGSSTPEPATVG
jgi:outer membrane lipase/esterase